MNIYTVHFMHIHAVHFMNIYAVSCRRIINRLQVAASFQMPHTVVQMSAIGSIFVCPME